MRYLLLALLLCPPYNAIAQSRKITPADRSALTGIQLPAGSKEDKRLLSVSSANMLLEDVGSKSGMSLGSAEVFYLPAASADSNAISQLNQLVAKAGWAARPVTGEPACFWLRKAERQVLAFYEPGKKETSLYLAEAKPVTAATTSTNAQTSANPTSGPPMPGNVMPSASPAHTGYQFTTTNFDDGWTAKEEANWVRVDGKGMTVLIHHFATDMTRFANDDEGTAFVWNQLIQPRYSAISNLWVRKRFWTDGLKYYAEAHAVRDGRQVFVALYRGGNGQRWMEFIAPDKKTFESVFGQVVAQEGTDWNRLSAMANCNRFAIAPNDLTGTWSGWSGAGVEYVNIYTGLSAGMGHAQSGNEIRFLSNGQYTREYKGVSGSPGGANQYHGEKNEGKAIVSNWEIQLTNAYKGQTHVFSAQFEAVQGGRILHLYRGNIEEMHLYRQQ